MTEQATPEDPVRIRDMPWIEFMKLLRTVAKEIGQLSERGDLTARRVMAYYKYAYDHPNDQKANLNLRTAFEDYVNRDLRKAEVVDLGSKFGHRLPEDQKVDGNG